MMAGIFGWSYQPGVTGNEPEIVGHDYDDDDCCEDCGCWPCDCEPEYDNMREIDDAYDRDLMEPDDGV